MPKPELTDYTTKELEAEVRKRRGYDALTVDSIMTALPTFDLGTLGQVRREVNAIWDLKMAAHVGLTDQEKALLAERDFVGCVRAVRERLGVGLVDAKAFVDKWKGVP